MSSRKGVLRGSKLSSSHSTLIDDAQLIVVAAKRLAEVTKVVVGKIVPLRPSKRRLKFIPLPAGFRITVRGSSVQQTIFVYTKNSTATQRSIEVFWESIKQ